MTIFILLCAVMTLAAIGWVARPLLRPAAAPVAETGEADKAAQQEVQEKLQARVRRDRKVIIAVLAITVPALSFVTYSSVSNFNWSAVTTVASSGSPHEMDSNQIQAMMDQLEERLRANPQDLDGWMMLGRSYTATERFARAADAYEQAYKLSGGENVDAMTGLAEALAMNDQASLVSGRAGQLFEAALVKSPNDSKALWYGGIAALQSGKLNVARDRLQLLLTQNPPEQIRTLLEQQVQDLNTQLGQVGNSGSMPVAANNSASAPAGSASSAAAAGARVIEVSVTISPDLLSKLPGPTPVFILARDPAGGPPFAVERRLSAELPVRVRLNEQSAMVAGRSLATAGGRVQIIARVARSGTPQAQNGDFFGEAEYDFSKGAAGEVKITIDREVSGASAAVSPQPPMAAAPSPAPKAAAAAGGRLLKVSVSIAPELARKLSGSAPLFVLARDPSGGPPLAVKRQSSTELPLTVELDESSAMVAGRSIANVQRVQVVARVSRSGSPIGQSGDLFGEAEYDFTRGPTGALNIVIDRTIP